MNSSERNSYIVFCLLKFGYLSFILLIVRPNNPNELALFKNITIPVEISMQCGKRSNR